MMYDLSNSAFELFQFFELTPDLVCIADKNGFFKNINAAVPKLLGYTKEELFARPIASFIYPEDKAITAATRAEMLEGKPLINFQNRYIRKDGSIVWLHWTSIYIPEKELVFAIAKDVTVRKEAEQDIHEKYQKFKSLATHFKQSMEKDRKYLAIELHEELAQLASVVKMDLDWVRNSNPMLSESSMSRLEHGIKVSELLVNAIRRISYEISPNMLENLGLTETLKWLCGEFSILNGIPCKFESELEVEHLAHEIKLDLFRICQEALSNVMYHAEASNVRVVMHPADEQLYLDIVDDGKGFDFVEGTDTAGLTSIRKRVASINGQLRIDSQPGKGTVISVCIDPQRQIV
jgi:PAS domain S-box-containing protein